MIREAVIQILNRGPVTLPAFSGATTKLRVMLKDPNVDLNKVAEIIKLDPGLASQYLRPVSASDRKKTTVNIGDALKSTGLIGIKQGADSAGVVDHVDHMRAKVHWNQFWLHSVFTARLTEMIAKAYFPITGMEYLSGLMHDSGKAFLEHYFPQEFEKVLFQVMERGTPMYEAEEHLLGITHAEISALLCEKWNLHRDIVRAVRFHHDPESPFNKDPNHPETEKFLATCVCVADSLANLCRANIHVPKDIPGTPIENLPGWSSLQKFQTIEPLSFDLKAELDKAHQAIAIARASGSE